MSLKESVICVCPLIVNQRFEEDEFVVQARLCYFFPPLICFCCFSHLYFKTEDPRRKALLIFGYLNLKHLLSRGELSSPYEWEEKVF